MNTPRLRFAVLAPLVRALLAPVRSRPQPEPPVASVFVDARDSAVAPEETDDGPVTVRRAA